MSIHGIEYSLKNATNIQHIMELEKGKNVFARCLLRLNFLFWLKSEKNIAFESKNLESNELINCLDLTNSQANDDSMFALPTSPIVVKSTWVVSICSDLFSRCFLVFFMSLITWNLLAKLNEDLNVYYRLLLSIYKKINQTERVHSRKYVVSGIL